MTRANRSWRVDFVDVLYGELAEAGSITSAVQVAADEFNAAWGVVQLIHRGSGQVRPLASFGMGAADIADYERVVTLDPWPAFYRRTGAATSTDCVLSQDIVDDEELRATPFYHEFWEPKGLFHTCGFVPNLTPDWSLYVGFPRFEHRGPYQDSNLPDIRFAARHFHYAARLIERINRLEERAALRGLALDRLNFAVALVTGDGRLLEANQAARDLIGPNAPFRLRHGRLIGNFPDTRDDLNAALTAVAGICPVPPSPFRVPDPTTGRSWIAYLWPGLLAEPAAYCLLLLDEHQDADGPRQALTQLFGLSTAEAAILSGLVAGSSLEVIAESRRVTRETVRSQLKSLLAKTGCHRQGQLVALCARLTPPFK